MSRLIERHLDQGRRLGEILFGLITSHQIHTYAERRQQIHDDLRLQHPEWIEPSGEAPMCDFYEARLMELLGAHA